MSTPPPGQWPPPQPGHPDGYQWRPQSASTKSTGSGGKWVLGGLALLVVIVVTVVATVLFTRDGGGESVPPIASTQTVSQPNVASADDRDPAGIILDDPTCEQWRPISAAFAQGQQNGWHNRDPATPASQWTADQRTQYDAVGAVLRETADRTVEVATKTPHRLMRELYEQFIAYSRVYADAIPSYTAESDHYVRVSIAIADTLNAVCDAIAYGAAGARSPLTARAAPTPGQFAIANVKSPEPFLTTMNPECTNWLSAAKQFVDQTAAWRTVDANLPADQLNEEQRMINAAVSPVMDSFATQTQLIGRESDVFVWADIATLSAQYRRAYASALLTYAPADNFLQLAAGSAVGAISEACRAVGAR